MKEPDDALTLQTGLSSRDKAEQVDQHQQHLCSAFHRRDESLWVLMISSENYLTIQST